MTNDLELSLGTLRSSMQLTLHTHHALRIWHGRDAAEGRASIIGLNGFLAVMNKMKRGAELDDPYADAWMLRIEDKIYETKECFRIMREQVDLVMSELPEALSLSENFNVQPIKIPLFINAQLGFLAVYLLAAFDAIARDLILAHHTALISRRTFASCLDDGSHALRSLFALAQQYKASGLHRDDYRSNTAAAVKAKERFGEVAADILDGTRRSPFAPPLLRRGPQLEHDDDPPLNAQLPDSSTSLVTAVDDLREDSRRGDIS